VFFFFFPEENIFEHDNCKYDMRKFHIVLERIFKAQN